MQHNFRRACSVALEHACALAKEECDQCEGACGAGQASRVARNAVRPPVVCTCSIGRAPSVARSVCYDACRHPTRSMWIGEGCMRVFARAMAGRWIHSLLFSCVARPHLSCRVWHARKPSGSAAAQHYVYLHLYPHPVSSAP